MGGVNMQRYDAMICLVVIAFRRRPDRTFDGGFFNVIERTDG